VGGGGEAQGGWKTQVLDAKSRDTVVIVQASNVEPLLGKKLNDSEPEKIKKLN